MRLEQRDAPTAARPHDWIRAHPVVSFFVLAYSISWTAWGAAYLGLGMAGVVVGGFGPMAAAWLAGSGPPSESSEQRIGVRRRVLSRPLGDR